jgi:hypothetical protein
MAAQSGSRLHRDLEIVLVGYFPDGADAYRAIDELIDDGFEAAEIGAAFRTRRAEAGGHDAAVGEIKGVRELTEKNPAVSGSVGGPGSRDQAVTPAGLAPGSGNAFPAPSKPGPIPGAEVPQTLPRDVPETLPHNLPNTPSSSSSADASWLGHLKKTYGSGTTTETAENRSMVRASDRKFGTGEGTLGLFPAYEYSATVFEESFVQMGLGKERARSLSRDLARGGGVVTVRAGARVTEAEEILERNRGRIRMEMSVSLELPDRESPVQVYGTMLDYFPCDQEERRKAS